MRSIGIELTDLLEAIADGRVTRDELDGTRRGMWALYMLDGLEVGMSVRQLRRLELVLAPLVGPPRITEDGTKYLDDERPGRQRG